MKSIFVITNLIFSLGAFKEPTDLYIIGDSLSDNGNTFELSGGKRPNTRIYTNHRYSNGPVWNDYLAEKYPNLNIKNYAVGGATTDNDVVNLVPGVPSVKDQALKISEELSKSAPKKCGSNKKNKRIAFVWGGSNDLFVNATASSKAIIPSLLNIANILKQTKKFDHIFLCNLVNVAHTPFGMSLPPAENEGLNLGIIQLNQALAKAINGEQAKDPSQHLTLVDADQMAMKLVTVPSSKSLNWEPYGFCVDDLNPLTAIICNNPNDYFFWDNQHPNTESHRRISNELDAVFKQFGYI
jgi:phospholipase/lecithinase/hemolysin